MATLVKAKGSYKLEYDNGLRYALTLSKFNKLRNMNIIIRHCVNYKRY